MRWLIRPHEYYPWAIPLVYFFLGLFLGLLGEICAVIWIHRKIRLSSLSASSRTQIGRMDTPPKGTPQSYSALNPQAYNGRMDTPPKGDPKSYSALNPQAYLGRMDTPSVLKTPAFCPKCGQGFSPFVQKILRQKKACFCENCGFSLSSL